MSVSGIQGQLLEVTVVGCNKLKDTEWISRQDPYVCLEYATTKFRTRTHTDGGKNPVFQEKFVFTLIEGLRELNVVVWNSNTMTYDDFIGSGKIQLQKVLTEGFDDTVWTIHSKTGRYAGEVPQYPMPPPSTASYSHPSVSYPAPSPYPGYTPPPSAYPPAPASYPPPYAPPPSAYRPAPYPPAPAPYPYQHPPPPSAPSHYPPGSYHGAYPPPPY
ncbi:hypothetical protein Leryth_004314 [Lithospermum erythrorhizon]|nr:hypothetical protein Leryth_004314 [Lithospermum erythrorhizon]